MLLHINGKFKMGNLKSSLICRNFFLKRHSLSIPRCTSSYEANLTVSVSVEVFIPSPNGVDATNDITKHIIIW
jgi:hypothetical protein